LKRYHLINSGTVFISTILVISAITVIVYATGVETHRSLYQNSLITITVLFIIFLCFITWGLYKGWKLKDTIGNFRNYFEKLKKPGSNSSDSSGFGELDLPDIGSGDGLEGCFFAVIIWLLVGIFGSIVLWFVDAFFWGMLLILGGLFYWITFRAFRLIFKNSPSCRGDILKSFKIAFLYSALYASWIYAIIFASHYLHR
jgi:hypothetical protein